MNNTTWKTQGLCYGHPNPDLWFPSIDRRQKRTTAIQAQQICARCPVTEECADYANRNDERHGVWAGINRKGHGVGEGDGVYGGRVQHGRIHQPDHREPPTEDPRCGSVAGHSAHRRRNERPCDACRIANNISSHHRRPKK